MSTVDPGASVSTAVPQTAPGSGVPASPADGSVAASPAASPESVGLRQLREQYEATKSQLEQWTKFGKPEEVSRSHQAYQRLYSEASRLGVPLGYSEADIHEALATNPYQTLDVLREMAQKANQNPQQLTPQDLQRLVERQLQEKLRPFEQEREERLDKDAESRFDGEFGRLFTTSFPNGFPDSGKEAISGLAWQLLIDNKDAYNALRTKGDMSFVPKAFEQAKTLLLKIITDYGEHEKTRIGTPQIPQQRQAPRKTASIDDIINNLGNPNVPMAEVFNGR